MAIEGREKGRGSSNDRPTAPSRPQKISKGKAKPSILGAAFASVSSDVLPGVSMAVEKRGSGTRCAALAATG